SPAARDLGAVVVFNDEIHDARFVQKTHTASVSAFRSPLAGPIGWIVEGRVRVVLRSGRRVHVPVSKDRPHVPVALVTTALGDDGRLLDALPGLGFGGVVMEALGGGHVPVTLVERLAKLSQEMPVVLASRIGTGETLRSTYAFPGSEMDLLGRGLIPAGIDRKST